MHLFLLFNSLSLMKLSSSYCTNIFYTLSLLTDKLVSNSPFLNFAVVLVNLLRSNLTRVVESREQPFEHTFWRDLGSARLMILNATITAFIFFVLHHRRLLAA